MLIEERFREFLASEGIEHVEVLLYLQERIGKEQLYPRNYDGHPNRNGYRVAAKAVREHLRE
jgi:lysophospholipase L1-like esterase